MRACAEKNCCCPALKDRRYCSTHDAQHPSATPYHPGEEVRIARWVESLKGKARP